MTTFHDFLGNEIEEGTYIVYASGSGHSKNVSLGQILKITPLEWEPHDTQEKMYGDRSRVKSVQVQPVKSSRWQQHHQRTKYIDTRTGKGVDLWLEKDGVLVHQYGKPQKHRESGEGYTHGEVKEFMAEINKPWAEWREKHRGWGYVSNHGVTPQAPKYHSDYDYFEYVGYTHQPWIRVEKQPIKPVTLTVVANVIRVDWREEDELAL